MPTLTKARTAQLCDEIRKLRLEEAAAFSDRYSREACQRRELDLEMALFRLVLDLRGSEAALSLNEALSYSPTTGDIEAHRAANAARQQAYLQRAQAATAQVPA